MKKLLQVQRNQLSQAIRNFFNKLSFIEVEVPILSSYTIPESTIELYHTEQTSPYESPTTLSLLPSPELYLKPLLAEGWGDLFCFNRSFRNSEQQGNQHNGEFTMLEYYAVGKNYIDSIEILQQLLGSLPHQTKRFEEPFLIMTIEEAFQKWAGFNLKEAVQNNELYIKSKSLGLSASPDWSIEELFNLIMVSTIEEALPKDQGVILRDYPAFVFTTAKSAPDPFWVERWELYIDGIEIANCYSERESEEEMREYFKRERELIPINQPGLEKVDQEYCRIFKTFPKSSGTAIGVDRLLMVITGTKKIEELLLFPNKKPIFP